MSKTGEGWGDSHEQTFRTKGELAYDLVKARVLDGSLVPGSVVNQAALAQQIGMSTTPLREGLRRLSAEGLIRLDAHRDATIAPHPGLAAGPNPEQVLANKAVGMRFPMTTPPGGGHPTRPSGIALPEGFFPLEFGQGWSATVQDG